MKIIQFIKQLNNAELGGEVFMNMFRNLGLPDIKVRYLPAILAYEHYLEGTKIDVDRLKLEKCGSE